MMKLISVPKTPRSAYDPKRRVSSLLKAQIANLEAVTRKRQGVTRASRPKTEGQASAYIAELTRQLHPEALGATPPPVATDVPAPDGGKQKAKGKRQKVRGGRQNASGQPQQATGK